VNYKIEKEDKQYKVVETATGYVIFTYTTQAEAKKMMKHLNLGGGFDGWSPAFILNTRKK
jgi:hypothetical protein